MITMTQTKTATDAYVDYIFDDYKADAEYIDAMDMVDDCIDESCLTDEDYLAGWDMTRAEVLGFENYEDCYSTFDENDYEYLQGIN